MSLTFTSQAQKGYEIATKKLGRTTYAVDSSSDFLSEVVRKKPGRTTYSVNSSSNVSNNVVRKKPGRTTYAVANSSDYLEKLEVYKALFLNLFD